MTQGLPEPPGTWHAKIFLAYASEDRDVALAVQDAIKKYAAGKAGGKITVTPWEENNELTKSILDNVQSTMRKTEFGVFVYSPVDGKARDNVVFESGLFIGMKADGHTLILLPDNSAVAPTDLDGLLGLKYPYNELGDAENHAARVGMLGGVGAVIVDRIRAIMAQSPPYQEQSVAGQPRPEASKGQPPTALEMISMGLAAQAALGKLLPVDGDVWPGRIVVHAAHGIGRVMGFDPPAAEPRYVEVQFGTVIGRYRQSELFVAPIDL